MAPAPSERRDSPAARAPGQKVVAVATVKNELDIVEAFVRHTLAFADHLVVLDNDSTDGSRDVLARLREEGLALTVVEHHGLGQRQSEDATWLMREWAVNCFGADWVLPLDADQFLAGGPLVPAGASTSSPLLLTWRDYVPDAADDPAERNPVLRVRRRLARGCGAVNVMVPRELACRPEAVLPQGHHELRMGAERREAAPHPSAYLGHYPIRSPAQYLGKVAVAHLQYLVMVERDPNLGWVYQEPYRRLASDPAQFLADFRHFAARYLKAGGEGTSETVEEPLPYRGGPLRYTPPAGGPEAGWLTVLRYAEGLARRYGVLSATLDPDGQQALSRTAAVVDALRAHLVEYTQRVRAQEVLLVEKERLIQQQAALLRQPVRLSHVLSRWARHPSLTRPRQGVKSLLGHARRASQWVGSLLARV